MIGKTISHYKVLEKLGEGGMGVVYKAVDTKLDRFVALKFLPQHVSTDGSERARFHEEAKAAATLNHPNVCTIYGVEEFDGQYFIQMEYVEGETLHALSQRGPLSPSLALECALQVGEALHEAHQRGIVHRDIKSENIMINTRKQVKVMDFGLAKLRGSLKLTKATTTVGTLAYMAPEQIQGSVPDSRGDLFSFGVVLYEMLSGHLPFRGEHEAAMMYSILNEDPQPLTIREGVLPAGLEQIIAKLLEKDPDERYQSAQDLLVDLRRARKQSGRISQAVASARVAADGISAAAPQRKRRYLIPMVVGAVLVLVAAVAAVVLLPGQRLPFEKIEIRRITSSGSAGEASISPDGKVIAHVLEQKGESSLRVLQIATGSTVEIIPPFKGNVKGTAITPDGEYLLYVQEDRAEHLAGAVYRTPLFGGTTRKIVTQVMGTVGVSSDGTRLAFIRVNLSTGQDALIVTSADGTGERNLAVRDGAKLFFDAGEGGPAWSPDDRLIAVPGGAVSDRFEVGIVLVSVEDGTERWLGPTDWVSIHRMVWLPDGSGVIFLGSRPGASNYQVWCASYPGGAVRRITSDVNSYGTRTLGLTRDGTTLVAVVMDVRSNIQLAPVDQPRTVKEVTSGSDIHGRGGLTTLPDGRIIYTAAASGNNDLWIVSPDGTGARQLTVESSREEDPVASPDGSTVVFVSDRGGIANIWKMRVDGTGAERLTASEDYGPSITPDGKWVYYYGWGAGTLNVWRVPLAGGSPEQVLDRPSNQPVISPDGKLLACVYQEAEGSEPGIAILPIDGGRPLLTLEDADHPLGGSYAWSADGKSLLYTSRESGATNIYAKPLDGGPSQPVTDFASGEIFSFRPSRDGRSLVLARGSMNGDIVLINDVR